MKEKFNASADGTFRKPENAPDPARVAERNILTRDSIAHRAAQHPAPPQQSYEIDQEGLRQAALDSLREQQRADINHLRTRLREQPEKARRDFGTARDYRGEERER